MELRTTFNIPRSDIRISYNDPSMFIGSCFAAYIGRQLEAGKIPVMINPSGTVYNPVSVCNTLDTITSGRKYKISDLYKYKKTWLSFNHYTDFSAEDPDEVLERINNSIEAAEKFLAETRSLFITFGTARVYRWKGSGKVVSNCHKIPASEFTGELLSVKAVVSLWKHQLDRLRSIYPDLKIVFTISPVRHWKDGAHGNQVSKSVLFLAIEELLGHRSKPEYFPAYELVMDDLRDYRFYNDDMLHPSSSAIHYIWNAFYGCYLDRNTMELWKEVTKITRARDHRIQTSSQADVRKFAENMISMIETIRRKMPSVNLESELIYYKNLLNPR